MPLTPVCKPLMVLTTDDDRDDTPSVNSTVCCLRNILDDDTYSKYSAYSNMNICQAANLGHSDVGQFTMEPPRPPPPPEPPLSINHTHVQDVHHNEWTCDEAHLVDVTWSEDTNPPPYEVTPHTNHLLWNTFMFPNEDMDMHSITPATILTMLAENDESRFTVLITKPLLASRCFSLQADGGANRSVINNREILHVSWDIVKYSIGGIGYGIMCTAKVVFHLICDNGSVLPVQMYYSPMATETAISPTDIVFNNTNKYDSWWQCNN